MENNRIGKYNVIKYIFRKIESIKQTFIVHDTTRQEGQNLLPFMH